MVLWALGESLIDIYVRVSWLKLYLQVSGDSSTDWPVGADPTRITSAVVSHKYSIYIYIYNILIGKYSEPLSTCTRVYCVYTVRTVWLSVLYATVSP